MALRRRTFLQSLVGAGAFAAVAPAVRLLAEEPVERRFVSLYFNGGWDILLGPDARRPGTYAGLRTGYELLDEAYRRPMEVRLGDQTALWGAAMSALTATGPGDAAPHSSLCTLFKSVNMNTVAHPAGRAYMNTFRSPSGVVPRGSSFGTVMATGGNLHEGLVLPNVSLGMPSFNEGYAPDYTGVRTSTAPDILDLLQPRESLDDATESLLRAAQDAAESCVGRAYEGRRPADDMRASRDRVRRLLSENVGRLFDIRADTAEARELRGRYGLSATAARNPRDPRVVAAITGQLLATGLSRSVSAQIQTGMDTHNTNWQTTQGPRLRAGFEAIAHLLWDLRRDDPNLERTTVVVHSEFARTPKINGTGGRDHWFANAVLVFGGGLRRGVVGATREDNLGLQKTNLATGAADEGGEMLKPEHIAATLALSHGLDPSIFRTDPLTEWIEGGV
ncbi:MAG: DUF1501 domain-containing protein [Deltaproteobacteria bacterium]|nr:DUF1501 domain-containing protein [Deltaproteobacteria bacterium]